MGYNRKLAFQCAFVIGFIVRFLRNVLRTKIANRFAGCTPHLGVRLSTMRHNGIEMAKQSFPPCVVYYDPVPSNKGSICIETQATALDVIVIPCLF
jgi:hypothetical protein